MAKLVSISDAKRIKNEHIRIHNALMDKLTKAKADSAHYQAEIRKAADELVDKEVLRALEDTPAEEISQDKRIYRSCSY